MDESISLRDTRIAIVGLGLMGGSLALALRGRCRSLWAVDPNPETRRLAHQRRIVDRISANPAEILPEADLVVLAAPVRVILRLIAQLPSWHPGEPVVFDLGSTKAEICQAYQSLPERFDPIGGHPMCGKETSGLGQAEADLFRGAAFALTPLERTSLRARALAAQVVQTAGARAVWLDPATHDRWTAATSHMPYLLSIALSLATPEEAAPLIGPGFQSVSRLAGSSTLMMADILDSNRENVLSALSLFRAQLQQLEHSLRQGDEAGLMAGLMQGQLARSQLLASQDEGGAR